VILRTRFKGFSATDLDHGNHREVGNPWSGSDLEDWINRSLSKWLFGCAISPYILGLFVLLSASSVFNSFQTAFCSAFAVLLYYFDQMFRWRVTPQISEVFKNRLNSKEKLSAISASKKSEIREHLVEIVQYSASFP
jgi:hypothetical protein